MAVLTLPGLEQTPVILRRTRRARRMSLRVSAIDGRVTLSLPQHVGDATAKRFIEEKREWLFRTLAETPQSVSVPQQGMVEFEGARVSILHGPGRSVNFVASQNQLMVPERTKKPGSAVKAWLRTMARERLAQACDQYSLKLGKEYTKLTLRDPRTRWGSCSQDGRLMFSWRLVMAPPEVLQYVAAHEVGHLAEMNHGPDFWSTVETLFPDHAPHKRWLKRQGAALHRWKFED